MRGSEHGGGGLAFQLVDREARIGEPRESRRSGLDIRAHQGPVLVERGPIARGVLLEGERDLLAHLDLAAEHGKSRQAKAAQGAVQVGRTHGHVSAYDFGVASPLWQVGHQ